MNAPAAQDRMRIGAGLAVAVFVAALIAALFAGIGLASLRIAGTGAAAGAPEIGGLLGITILQAGLSTVVSVAAGAVIAWALNRVRFPGRAVFVAVLSAGLVLPALVVAFGVLAVWGRGGWIAAGLEAWFGTSLPGTIFGLHGVVFAHLILNGAFAARVLHDRLAAIPPNRLRLGRSLALSPASRVLALDAPAMLPALPGLSAVIFLFCFTSFAIVLTLGGGPGVSTFEVAIYEAVRFEFDLGLAARLALIQLGVCLVVILPAAGWPLGSALVARPEPGGHWPDRGAARLAQIAVIVLTALVFGLPMLAVLAGGIAPGAIDVLTSAAFGTALLTSLTVATLSAFLAVGLGLVLSLARAGLARAAASGGRRRQGLRLAIGVPAFAYVATPALVLALGFFLLVRQLGLAPGAAAPVVLVLANALLALPFAAAVLGPPLERLSARTGKLQRSLDISGRRRLLDIELPLVRADIGYAGAIAFCLSLGDLGVIALFGTAEFSTLPWLMYRAMGAYRSADASVIAAALLVLTLLAFLAIPRIIAGSRHADA